LREAGLLPADTPLSINAISGYSGGGKSMIEAHQRDGAPAFELYALNLTHKHLPEIILYAGLTRRPLFVPSVGHFAQGMLVSIPLFLDRLDTTAKELHDALTTHYEGSSLVRVLPADGDTLQADSLAGTDLLELRVIANENHNHAVLIARLDNLGKGASGAAVQNVRLMLGFAND